MSIRILKKALGLLIVDIVIIIGIFVLQFRTDSTIIKKIGNLQLTIESSEIKDSVLPYKNKFRIAYNGIVFYSDEQNPALALKNGESITVSLVDVEQPDPLSFVVKFTDNIKVTFELASSDSNSSLAILTELPADVSDFSIPYSYSSNMKIQKQESDLLILDSRRNTWELSAHFINSNRLESNRRNYIATYAVYDANQKFTFDSIVDLQIASYTDYASTVTQFKKNLVSAFEANNSESNITEQVAVSYIAAQAENGNYTRALENIPDSIKKSSQRTYLSAPYLNTLEEMNNNLERAMRDYEKRISDSASKGSFDLFTVHKIANFIYLYPDKAIAVKLLKNAAEADVDSLTLAQISGILQVYADLHTLEPEYAAVLEPVLENCVKRITESCKFEGNILTISENDTFLSVIQAVETGVSLLRYGLIVDDTTLQKAGFAIVNSYLAESSSFDLRTLSNLYPILAYDNHYYPHLEKVYDGENTIWAWTCARTIKCERTAEEITFTIDFPEGDTHYIILKGVPQFNTIYIYDMAFRTDPRFETYNSSGYVYKKNTETLLLKSRHKSHFETVRLTYKENKPEPVPAVTTAVPVSAEENAATPAAETESEASESSEN